MKSTLRKEEPEYRLNLSGAQVPKTILTEANLVSANFSHANMEGADFSRSIAQDTDFSKANLRNAKFIDADLRNASLTGADLRGADFTGAKLDGADMTGARLDATRFAKLDISQVKGLSGYQIKEANVDRETVNVSAQQASDYALAVETEQKMLSLMNPSQQ